jgi:LPS export ABC transporter protein LptC
MIKSKLIILCICWLAALFLSSCEHKLSRVEADYTTDDTLVEVGEHVEILYSDSAVVRIRITAPMLRNYTERTDPRQEFPDGIKVEFLNPSQQVVNTLTSKFAVRQQEKSLVIARDSVVMNSAKQERIETEELTWDERSAKIRTDKFVKVSRPGEVIYGFGLEANQDFSYWKILVPKGKIKADQLKEAAQ